MQSLWLLQNKAATVPTGPFSCQKCGVFAVWPPACRSGGGRPGRTVHRTPSLCAPAEAPARRTPVVKHPQAAPLAPRPSLAPVSAGPATLGLHQALPCLEVPLWLWCVGCKDSWKLFSRRRTHCRAQAWRGSRCQIALPRGLAPITLTWGPWALILPAWGRGTQSVQRAGPRLAVSPPSQHFQAPGGHALCRLRRPSGGPGGEAGSEPHAGSSCRTSEMLVSGRARAWWVLGVPGAFPGCLEWGPLPGPAGHRCRDPGPFFLSRCPQVLPSPCSVLQALREGGWVSPSQPPDPAGPQVSLDAHGEVVGLPYSCISGEKEAAAGLPGPVFPEGRCHLEREACRLVKTEAQLGTTARLQTLPDPRATVPSSARPGPSALSPRPDQPESGARVTHPDFLRGGWAEKPNPEF